MFEVEREDDGTEEGAQPDDVARAALAALTRIVAAAPPGAVRVEAVRARIDHEGTLEFELPLGSGDAFWLYVSDSWHRFLWVAAEGPNIEWWWDERSTDLIEAVLHGRATRAVTTVAGVRTAEVWSWTDADGRPHEQPDPRLIPRRRGLLERLLRIPVPPSPPTGPATTRRERIDPLPRGG